MNNIHHERYTIVEIQCHVLKPVPLKKAFYDATMGPFLSFQTAILSIKDKSGIQSEVEYPVSGIPLLKSIFGPVMLNTHDTLYTEIFSKLFWMIRNEGHRGSAALALGHLDRVFYDIASQRNQQALHRYLGADRNWAKVYASGGSTGLSDEELIEECMTYQEEGYDIIKIKTAGDFGRHLKQDILRIEKVRKALGDKIQIAVDANQVLSVDQAIEFSKSIEEFDIAWFEEPLLASDVQGLKQLTKKSSIPISCGESERIEHLFPLLIEAGASHIQPVIGNMISIDQWFSVYRMTIEKGLTFSCGGSPCVNTQIVATLDQSAMNEYLMPYLQAMEAYYTSRPKFINGKAYLPDHPGISLRFNWEKIRKQKLIVDEFKLK